MSKDVAKDALIDEVRERRRALLARHGNDLDRLLVSIREVQERHAELVGSNRRREAAPRIP
jgi:hypothetical protein